MKIEEPRSDAELITLCAQEPIRIPGTIQSHGILVVINERTIIIEQASENIGDHFPLRAKLLAGHTLTDLFGEAKATPLIQALASRLVSPRPALLGTIRSKNGDAFDILAHQHDGQIILEFEHSPVDTLNVRQAPYQLNTIMDGLHAAQSPEALFQKTTEGVRALTNFDKVMLYRFDPQWNGVVVAESQIGTMVPYLHHRFPASDIPAQARELYRLNPIRITCDVNAVPVPIFPTLNPETNLPLDMTYAALRSVSPVHIRYLQNMHVHASMSISILREGVLWGLIACHHQTPLYIPHHLRIACQFLAEMFVSQLAEKEAEEERHHRHASQKILRELTGSLKPATQAPITLKHQLNDLFALIDADGVAVCIEGNFGTAGTTPSEKQINRLTQWLHTNNHHSVFRSEWLPEHYLPAADFHEIASGIIAISLSVVRSDYLIWFRREQIQTVQWAGDPHLHVTDGPLLAPRKSFDTWSEQVGMKSRPWRLSEIEVVTSLRETLVDIFLRRAELAAAQAKDHFMAILSHELRTPLNPVLLAVTALETDRSFQGENGELLKLIKRNVQIQTRLIDDLLDVTRISKGKLSLILAPTNLHEVLRHAVEVCAHEAHEKDLTLSMDLQANNPTVIADTARLQQVFWNLLKNAIKFTPSQGTIHMTTINLTDKLVRIEVTDSGVGISDKLIPFIFDAYEQGGRTTTTRYGGLGLGLAISHDLVKLHHGSIGVRSAGIGRGTTFTVDLPETAPPAELPGPLIDMPPVETGVSLQILLVEDHVETSRVMIKLLTQLGYQPSAAGTAADARALSGKKNYDLIICDLGLPDGDGVDLLKELRKHSHVPAIALSGYGMEADVRRCMEAGFDRHLVKPVDFKILQKTILQVTL